MSRPRVLRWVAGVIVLAVAGTGWLVSRAMPDPGIPWSEIGRGELTIGIEITGALRATSTSTLGPPPLRELWEYKIAHLAPEGEEVEEGTPVLGFDSSELQQRLERQQAEAEEAQKQIEKTEKNLTMVRRQDELRLAEAEAELRKARLTVERPGELSSAQELAQARLDLELAEIKTAYLNERLAASARSAQAQLGALESQRERAEGRVGEIRQAIEDMMRKAPRDGTVVYVKNWRDETKKVGDTCWRGEKVIELPDLRAMQAEGQVDEADAGRLVEGQRVTFRLDAHPDVEFGGKVDSIWKTVQRQSWRNPLKIARLRVQLDETDAARMRPGMRFRGNVEVERVTDALLIPIEAVFQSPDGPVAHRRTLLGHETVALELGRRDGRNVEILSGLDSGAEVSLVDLGAAGS